MPCHLQDHFKTNLDNGIYLIANTLVKAKHCDYTTGARNNFLLDSLAACNDVNSKLVMYFYSEYSFCQLH